MNNFFTKYIGQVFISISVFIIIGGLNMSLTVGKQDLRIETLEEQTMSEELILEKIENINHKFEDINDDINKQDKKLDKIIDKLYDKK